MKSDSDIANFFGFLILRVWLGIRALITGIEKFSGSRSSEVAVNVDGEPNSYGLTADASDKVYGFSHYGGVPEALYKQLADEPLIPEFALKIYDIILGPVLILSGIALLLGLATRYSLLAMGLVYSSLTVGLILLKQDGGIAWLAIHVLLAAVALFNVRHNRFAVISKL